MCHLLDTYRNLDTPYFHSIRRQHDDDLYKIVFCLLDEGQSIPRVDAEFDGSVSTLAAGSRLSYPMAVLRLAALLRKGAIGLLHAHFFYPTCVGLLAAKLTHVPFVFTRHHSDHNIRLEKRWHIRVDALCAKIADHVIAVSDATRRMMVEIEGVPSSQITVVHNGMNPLCAPAADRVAQVRQELALPPGRTCLMIARLHEEKGHVFLFDAVRRIEKAVGRVNLLLAGAGPHRAFLEEQVRARRLEGGVWFLGRRADIPELICMADVVVLPSLAESFGFAIVEAMSLGKPVVGSDSGGLPEIIADGESGFIVPMRAASALADAVIRILRDDSLAAAMGAAGRKRALRFSVERMINGYESVYEKVWRTRPHDSAIGRRSLVA